MFRTAGKLTIALLLVLGSIGMGALFSYGGSAPKDDPSVVQADQSEPVAPPTIVGSENRSVVLSTSTPQPSATATLLPPPTFEPPTATPTASQVPTETPTQITQVDVNIPGLQGLETATPSSTPGCTPREDWTLTYTVQFDDALASIADRYGTWVDELAEGNCIDDPNVIVVGQVLRVPGDAQPYVPQYDCSWEVLTPFNGSVTVPADGDVTFNWRGPASQLNLIRIYRPDGTIYEQLVELRQNDTIDLTENLPAGGTYTWYVYPLGSDFMQIDCTEGGPWVFAKPESDPTTNSTGTTTNGMN